MTLITPVTPSDARTPRLGWRGSAVAGWRPLRLRQQLLSRLLSVLALGAGLACSGDHLTVDPPRDPSALYWELALNHRAVTLSLLPPYDTLTLVATPRNAHGEPLADLGTPQYSSPDLDRVQVDSNGVLKAVGLTADGQPLAVAVTLTAGNLQHVDTVLVRVVADTLPKLASLSIHPIPPDSAKAPALEYGEGRFTRPLPIQAVDGTGSPIDSLLVAVRSSDALTAAVRPWVFDPRRLAVAGQRPGVATLVASATVFGVAKADTVAYRVGWPIFWDIGIQRVVPASGGDTVSVFDPQEVRVGTGAVVRWTRKTEFDTTEIAVTFADGDTASVTPADDPSHFFWVTLGNAFQRPPSDTRLLLCSSQNVDCDGGGSFVLAPGGYAGGLPRLLGARHVRVPQYALRDHGPHRRHGRAVTHRARYAAVGRTGRRPVIAVRANRPSGSPVDRGSGRGVVGSPIITVRRTGGV